MALLGCMLFDKWELRMQKEHLSGQGKPWPDLLTRKKERDITMPHIKICDAVDKEEPMGAEGNDEC